MVTDHRLKERYALHLPGTADIAIVLHPATLRLCLSAAVLSFDTTSVLISNAHIESM